MYPKYRNRKKFKFKGWNNNTSTLTKFLLCSRHCSKCDVLSHLILTVTLWIIISILQIKTLRHKKVINAHRHTAGEWWAGHGPGSLTQERLCSGVITCQLPSIECLLCLNTVPSTSNAVSHWIHPLSHGWGGCDSERLNRLSENTQLESDRAPFDPGLSAQSSCWPEQRQVQD